MTHIAMNFLPFRVVDPGQLKFLHIQLPPQLNIVKVLQILIFIHHFFLDLLRNINSCQISGFRHRNTQLLFLVESELDGLKQMVFGSLIALQVTR